MAIQFSDVCLITDDVFRLRSFYESVFGGKAEGDEIHSGLSLNGMFFAFDHAGTLQNNPAFRYVSANSANNVIIGFNVDDADAEFRRLSPLNVEMLGAPIDPVITFTKAVQEMKISRFRVHPAWLVNKEADNPYNHKTKEIISIFHAMGIPISSGNDIFPGGIIYKTDIMDILENYNPEGMQE